MRNKAGNYIEASLQTATNAAAGAAAVTADAAGARQILLNILDNSVRYTPAGAQPVTQA